MRHARVAALCGLLLTLAALPADAQAKDEERWQIALESGDYVWDIRLVRLSGDSLVFRQADTLGSASVQQIRELRLIRKTEMRLGEVNGGAIGALTGSDDEVYDLTTMDYAARIRAVQQVLLLHPPRP